MGHSFVTFRDRDQMMPDGDIVTVVHIVLDAAQDRSNSPELTDNIKALIESWSTLIDVYGPGCLDLGLDEFVRTEADRESLLRLTKLSRVLVQRFGPTVPGSYLNKIVDAPEILEFFDRPTADILAAFDKLIALIGTDAG